MFGFLWWKAAHWPSWSSSFLVVSLAEPSLRPPPLTFSPRALCRLRLSVALEGNGGAGGSQKGSCCSLSPMRQASVSRLDVCSVACVGIQALLLERGWHTCGPSGCALGWSDGPEGKGRRSGIPEVCSHEPQPAASSSVPLCFLLFCLFPTAALHFPRGQRSSFACLLLFSLSLLLPSSLRAECPPSFCKPQFPYLPNGKKNDSVCVNQMIIINRGLALA